MELCGPCVEGRIFYKSEVAAICIMFVVHSECCLFAVFARLIFV
ncbi:hypothetical protein DSUL_150005 [Desulfovibrionales bacterium]